ncbi:MAG: tetratricopeptide repeat protein, partial [Bacteroidales bacterium]|nr:tetratricopeptide repeat protein [Bacteroidales bacterium]
KPAPSNSSEYNGFIKEHKSLSSQQLLDTANHYENQNFTEKALICYNLIINTIVKESNAGHQKQIIEALVKSAVIYYHMCDYRRAYEFLIKALDLCEEYGYVSYKSKIYTNIGNIYYSFNKYDFAKLYYLKAMDLCEDSVTSAIILNNLGAVEVETGKFDSAFYYVNKSLQKSKHSDIYNITLNTIASVCQKNKFYDSAFFYFRLALNEAKKSYQIKQEAKNLSDLGKLFFEVKKTDSALFYINLSNKIALENNFLDILIENNFTLSKIEESKGHNRNALEYFRMYANLKDSIFKAEKFGEINQLQRLYEISKTNEQLEQLAIEQQMKEQTIYYQRIIWFITLIALLSVSIVLLSVFFQKRKLNTAYKLLFQKNLEIITLQEDIPEGDIRKNTKKTHFTDDVQQELLNKILAIMEDTSIICDPKFSINKLAELIQSNQNYVSQVINHALKKNFRSFLNSYRIKEAQRIFSEPDIARYTIESVALQVGFKSQTTFNSAFKEIIGVSPNFYLKSMQEEYKLVSNS